MKFNDTKIEKNGFMYRIQKEKDPEINDNFALVDNKLIIGSFSWDEQDKSHPTETALVVITKKCVKELEDSFKVVWRKIKEK